MGIFILLFWVAMFSLDDAETQNSIFKISECIKVVKYAIKIVQNSTEMRITMVSSICSIVYKNITSGTHSGVQKVFTVKTRL